MQPRHSIRQAIPDDHERDDQDHRDSKDAPSSAAGSLLLLPVVAMANICSLQQQHGPGSQRHCGFSPMKCDANQRPAKSLLILLRTYVLVSARNMATTNPHAGLPHSPAFLRHRTAYRTAASAWTRGDFSSCRLHNVSLHYDDSDLPFHGFFSFFFFLFFLVTRSASAAVDQSNVGPIYHSTSAQGNDLFPWSIWVWVLYCCGFVAAKMSRHGREAVA